MLETMSIIDHLAHLKLFTFLSNSSLGLVRLGVDFVLPLSQEEEEQQQQQPPPKSTTREHTENLIEATNQ